MYLDIQTISTYLINTESLQANPFSEPHLTDTSLGVSNNFQIFWLSYYKGPMIYDDEIIGEPECSDKAPK